MRFIVHRQTVRTKCPKRGDRTGPLGAANCRTTAQTTKLPSTPRALVERVGSVSAPASYGNTLGRDMLPSDRRADQHHFLQFQQSKTAAKSD